MHMLVYDAMESGYTVRGSAKDAKQLFGNHFKKLDGWGNLSDNDADNLTSSESDSDPFFLMIFAGAQQAAVLMRRYCNGR